MYSEHTFLPIIFGITLSAQVPFFLPLKDLIKIFSSFISTAYQYTSVIISPIFKKSLKFLKTFTLELAHNGNSLKVVIALRVIRASPYEVGWISLLRTQLS